MRYLNNKFALVLIFSFFSVGILTLLGSSPEKQVTYPEGYRDWTHAKSMILQPGHALHEIFGGIHHVYANSVAQKAIKSGGEYPDGSVLVFDLLESITDNNAIVEGKRKVVGVMERNSAKFSSTGGWGFEGFKGNTRERVVTDGYKQCFSCHLSEKENDFVFSKFRK